MPKLRHYPSFAGTFVNRHPLPRYKMCADLHIRQNAGVANPFFTGKNGNGETVANTMTNDYTALAASSSSTMFSTCFVNGSRPMWTRASRQRRIR